MLKGVDKLANAVAVTMGPTGRNVIIAKSFGGPTVTKDGVTVSKEVELDDPFENMGAKLVNEVASKTSDVAGDGTTTATVLARAIFKEGIRSVARGSNSMAVRRGIEKAVDAAVEHLKSMAKPVSKKDEIAQVGAISANSDMEIGNLLADAMEKVGKDGVITVEEGKQIETTLELVEGMQFDKGFISPYFINKPAEMECQLQDAYILIHEKKISNLRELIPLLEQIAQGAKHPPFHAARQRHDLVVALVPQREIAQHLLEVRRVRRAAEEAAAEAHRAPHRLEHVGVQLLRDQTDLRPRGTVVAHDVVAVDEDPSRGRRDDAADDADQRRLAGAVRAEQGEDFAPADLQVDALQRLQARSVGLGQARDGDHRRHRREGNPIHYFADSSLTGRTSMLPTRAGGIFAATWMASLRSLASIR